MMAFKISNLEKILFGLSLFLLLMGNFLMSGDLTIYFNKLSIAALMALGLLYAYFLKNKEGILCAILSMGMLFHFFEPGFEWHTRLYLSFTLIMGALGVFFLKKTIEESIRNKDFELFGTLISLSFFYPLLHVFYFSNENAIMMVYYFATLFLVAYVMYYENLWDKYTEGEKKILTLLLVFNLYEVGLISFKNIF